MSRTVLSFGGFLGLGDKLFVIPWPSLELQADERRFVLDLPRETLESAPGFDKDHWPNMADTSWRQDVDTHFGFREEGETGRRGPEDR